MNERPNQGKFSFGLTYTILHYAIAFKTVHVSENNTLRS